MDSAMISQPFTHRAWWPIRFSFHLPCALVVFVPRGQSVGLTQGFEHRGLLTVCRLHSWYHFSKLSEDVSLWNRRMLTRAEATTLGQHTTFLSRRGQKQFLKRPSVNWTVLGSICPLVSFWGSTCVFFIPWTQRSLCLEAACQVPVCEEVGVLVSDHALWHLFLLPYPDYKWA